MCRLMATWTSGIRACARLAERGKSDLIFPAGSSAVRGIDNLAIARDMEHQRVKREPIAQQAAIQGDGNWPYHSSSEPLS